MNVVGESLFIAARTFKGKKQQDLYTCKFLDEDGDEFSLSLHPKNFLQNLKE